MWWMLGSFFIVLPTSSTSPPLIGLLGFDSGVAAGGELDADRRERGWHGCVSPFVVR